MSETAVVKAITERLALALRATASRYRSCAPRTETVLDSIAEYLDDPEKATEQLNNEEERLRRLGLMR